MKIWFTSDQHFDHVNVIKYCNRPFQSVEEMNEELIRRHNVVVKPDDVVFHLGDFSMHPRGLRHLIHLNGRHHLIAGNHDRCHPVMCKSNAKEERMRQAYIEAGFTTVKTEDLLMTRLMVGYDFKLCHLPYSGDQTEEERYLKYRPKNEGLWLLHGHVHCAWKTRHNMINVGVDQWAFAPVSLEEIVDLVVNRTA